MDDKKKVVTWDRFESYGFAHWCLSQDGALLEWYGVPDGSMAWVAEEEARLRGPVNGDCEHQADLTAEGLTNGLQSEGKGRKFLVTLEREVTTWQHQEVEVEVEAANEEEAGRKAILFAEEDDFDGLWEVMDCEEPYEILVPPSAGSVEAISAVEDATR